MHHFGLMILQDYGEDNKWTKLISLKRDSRKGARLNLRLVAYMKSKGQVVIQYNGEKFLWFDVEKKKWVKTVTLKGIEVPFSSQVLPASLDWLNESDGAYESIAWKGISIRKRKRANERLQVVLKTSLCSVIAHSNALRNERGCVEPSSHELLKRMHKDGTFVDGQFESIRVLNTISIIDNVFDHIYLFKYCLFMT